MKKTINIKLIITLLLIPFVVFGLYKIINQKPNNVRAFGHLTVDLGVPSGDPIFSVSGMFPGDCVSREVGVENGADSETHVSVRSANQTDLDFLSRVLTMQISESSSLLYFDSVENFFSDSSTLDGVPLSTLPAFSQANYTFTVCFSESAGNEYQNTEVVFDLIFGEVISPLQLPEECAALTGIVTFVVEGTEEDDDIRATRENELILGYGGDDELDGSGGRDCIVGGTGDDEIDGGQGSDIIIGSEGNDEIDGGQADDLIYAGPGNDDINGGSGMDTIFAGPGDDEVDGRSHEDTIFGGPGNDDLDGGPDNDKIYGEEDDDELRGNTGNDFLDGGVGFDEASGGTGVDECIAEDVSSCEI